MKNKGYFIFKYIWLYIKDHVKVLVFLVVSAFIFGVILYLYNVPPEAFTYSLLLCLCLGGAMFATDFRSFYTTHRELTASLKSIHLTLDSLPQAGNTMDRDYEALIARLYHELNKTISNAENSRRYMTDYYALWIHQIKVPISAMYLLLGKNQKSSPLGIELFKIEQYVEMALSYVRMESVSTDYVFKEYNVDEILKQSVRKYAPLFIAKKISVDIEPTGIKTVTDEKWLSFIIEQLLSNSLKYTKSGTIFIYAKGDFDLVIEDTGIGIAPEDIKRIGEKGFTGYNGRADRKSTGLGLYMCYEILNKLSHSMDIESEIGKGTKVTVHLDRHIIKAD